MAQLFALCIPYYCAGLAVSRHFSPLNRRIVKNVPFSGFAGFCTSLKCNGRASRFMYTLLLCRTAASKNVSPFSFSRQILDTMFLSWSCRLPEIVHVCKWHSFSLFVYLITARDLRPQETVRLSTNESSKLFRFWSCRLTRGFARL